MSEVIEEQAEVAIETGVPSDAIVGKLLSAIDGHSISEIFAGITTMIDVVSGSVGISPLEVASRMVTWFADNKEEAHSEH